MLKSWPSHQMRSIVSVVFLMLVFGNEQVTNGARILAIIPTASYSHQIAFHNLWGGLCARGHEIVFITCSDIPVLQLPNYTQINIAESSFPILRNVDLVRVGINSSYLQFFEENFLDIATEYSKMVFEDERVRKLYASDSNEKFDLVMAEVFLEPSIYGFAHRFNAPLIGLSAITMSSYYQYIFGDTVMPTHPGNWELGPSSGHKLPFWHRLKNFLLLWYHIYTYLEVYIPKQDILMRKYLGDELPGITELTQRISIIFVNHNVNIGWARPHVPMMIPFTEMHIDSSPPLLPDTLLDFLSDAEEFIYFNLGSNVQATHVPEPIRQMFLEVFSKLTYKVLWKYEAEIERKPDNVYTAKWFPQQSILAHPKIKLFISHCGLQGTQETIHYSVPVLAMPILIDQIIHARKLEALGITRHLDISTLTAEEFHSAIMDMLTNASYKENIMKLKMHMDDKPYDTLSHLVWWTEYILRHKGADHLHSVTAELPWYQRQEMDIVAFLAVHTFVLTILGLIVAFRLSKCILRLVISSKIRGKLKRS